MKNILFDNIFYIEIVQLQTLGRARSNNILMKLKSMLSI